MSGEIKKEKHGGFVTNVMGFVSGFVDATGYIVLLDMFTANMSGNAIKTGLDLGQRVFGEDLFHRAFPIPIFMLGVTLASVLIEIATRSGFRRIFSTIVFVEAALLAIFLAAGGSAEAVKASRGVHVYRYYILASLPAVAMGMQTAVLHRVGSLSLRTTFVTGMMAVFCREGVRYLIWVKDNFNLEKNPALSLAADVFYPDGDLRGIWILYIAGAAASALTILYMGLDCLIIPILILFLAIGINFKMGEQVQSETGA
jgi:uncharacterized membrane protein YoaK (UPF0700 family)